MTPYSTNHNVYHSVIHIPPKFGVDWMKYVSTIITLVVQLLRAWVWLAKGQPAPYPLSLDPPDTLFWKPQCYLQWHTCAIQVWR